MRWYFINVSPKPKPINTALHTRLPTPQYRKTWAGIPFEFSVILPPLVKIVTAEVYLAITTLVVDTTPPVVPLLVESFLKPLVAIRATDTAASIIPIDNFIIILFKFFSFYLSYELSIIFLR